MNVLREERTMQDINGPLGKKDEIPTNQPVELFLESIKSDIVEPEFYANFAKLRTIELMQGALINGKPHYEKDEQFMCNVEGSM